MVHPNVVLLGALVPMALMRIGIALDFNLTHLGGAPAELIGWSHRIEIEEVVPLFAMVIVSHTVVFTSQPLHVNRLCPALLLTIRMVSSCP